MNIATVRSLLTILFAGSTFLVLTAQTPTLVSRAQVNITPENASKVPEMGVDLTHGMFVPGKYYINDLTSWEVERIRALGFEVTILIDDVTEFYQSQQSERTLPTCHDRIYDYPVPKNFHLGSMGGYLTYPEILDALDLMHHLYPHLITVRAQAGNELTHQGRPVFWVRISDNPAIDEQEPKVLYTGLHHAREPMSMMQMIYYMWYLLENYDKDPEITYLVDNTELYFIPCVNPDGYIYNQTIAPNGGGFWRKNMRDNNGDGVFDERDDGVDLNRNYAYQWGLDDSGSSSNPASSVYRGPEPFSEPETRAVRALVEQYDFFAALNYHAFGNYFIYPWGYTEIQNPDFETFAHYSQLMAYDNGFHHGTAMQTVGYPVNGSSDDWMYAEHGVFAMTPELGDHIHGFWPAASEIIPLCQASLKNNLALAHLPLHYATVTDLDGAFFPGRSGDIGVRIKHYGDRFGPMALTVASLSPDLQIDGRIQVVNAGRFEELSYSFAYSISESARDGDAVTIVIQLDNGYFEVRDTITKILASEFIVFAEHGEDLSQWIPDKQQWGITDEYAVSGTTSITDSPHGNYLPNTSTTLTLAEPIDLREAIHATLEFHARWEIEEHIDYAEVQISADGESFESLCGRFTVSGSIFQAPGPVYHGVQSDWVKESIDITPYVGHEVFIRFRLTSDAFFEMDGIYIDNLIVRLFTEEDSPTTVDDIPASNVVINVYPNPATDYVTIAPYGLLGPIGNYVISISDMFGVRISESAFNDTSGTLYVDTSQLPSGIYQVSLHRGSQLLGVQRLVIIR